MTADGISELLHDVGTVGQLPASVATADCITSFNCDIMKAPGVARNDAPLGTSYGTGIDLSGYLGSISRQQAAILVLLVYPQQSCSITGKVYDVDLEDWIETAYSSSNVSTNGLPVPFVWKATADTISNTGKAYLKLDAAGKVTWQLFRFYYCTGLDLQEPEE